MYFAVPARSQVTIVSSGASAPDPCRFSGFVQSSAANFSLIVVVIPSTGDSISLAEPAVRDAEPAVRDADPALAFAELSATGRAAEIANT
jgi:hypothetical protein